MKNAMKKSLLLIFVFAMGCLLAPVPGWAADPRDISVPLQKVRGLGGALRRATDRNAQNRIIERMKRVSLQVDNAVAVVEQDPATSPDTRAKLEEVKAIWADYQRTRDEEIIPAVLAGDMETARRLGTLVQLGRYIRMLFLLRP